VEGAPEKQQPITLKADDKSGFQKRALIARVGSQITIENRGRGTMTLHLPGGKQVKLGSEVIRDGKVTLLCSEDSGRPRLKMVSGETRVGLNIRNFGDVIGITRTSGATDYCFIRISPDQFYAVTDAKGRFVLPKLPDGYYVAEALHETLGSTQFLVKISGEPPDPINLVMEVPVAQLSKASLVPVGRMSFAMAYDPKHQCVALYGGWGTLDGTSFPLGDYWEWRGSRWKPVVFRHSRLASIRAGHSMSFDAHRNRVVVLGGWDVYRAKPWEWSEFVRDKGWRQIECMGVPDGPRREAALASDLEGKRIVLFGGLVEPRKECVSDTWVWNGDEWKMMNTKISPSARSGHAMVFDTSRECVFMFGGYGRKGGRMTPLADSWQFKGKVWTKIVTKIAPSARSGHAMAFDSIRGRAVLFGGFRRAKTVAKSALGDTWEWDGGAWHQAHPKSSPSRRWGCKMSYDARRKVVVLFGGHVGEKMYNDTWEWDGDEWNKRN